MAKVEAAPKLDGRNMIMVLAPDRRAHTRKQSSNGDQPADSRSPAGSETGPPPAAPREEAPSAEVDEGAEDAAPPEAAALAQPE
jgi:hypothetical protein